MWVDTANYRTSSTPKLAFISFPHASPDGANLALRAICLSGSWWGYDFIASPRLSSWWACGEFTGRKKGSVDFDLWIYGLPPTENFISDPPRCQPENPLTPKNLITILYTFPSILNSLLYTKTNGLKHIYNVEIKLYYDIKLP